MAVAQGSFLTTKYIDVYIYTNKPTCSCLLPKKLFHRCLFNFRGFCCFLERSATIADCAQGHDSATRSPVRKMCGLWACAHLRAPRVAHMWSGSGEKPLHGQNSSASSSSRCSRSRAESLSAVLECGLVLWGVPRLQPVSVCEGAANAPFPTLFSSISTRTSW